MLLGIQLICMLSIILLAAHLFSNALEYFGEKIGISSGVTGSIFAAIATALPETSVPVLAILAGTSDHLINEEISVGAILGAPLMLSTLSTFVMGISVINNRSILGRIAPEKTGFTRDLNFFLIAFFIATMVMFVPYKAIRLGLSFLLVGLYITYVAFTFKASKKLVEDGHGVAPNEALIFTKLGFKCSASTIFGQLVLGLVLLLFGAKGFIHGIKNISNALDISALLLSLLIIPIATELPEKVNSVIWVRKNKDTLGFGNITGAMVFQSTLLPAIGILITPWQPSKPILTGIIITFIAAVWLRLNASTKGLSIIALLVNGLLYFTYLFFIFS